MSGDYVLLIEKEEMWVRMLVQVLEDNRIPCTAVPVFGAGFSLKTGMQERLRIYVPAQFLPQATDLRESLFNAEILEEE